MNPHGRPPDPSLLPRNSMIVKLYQAGLTLAEVALTVELRKQRVHQIVQASGVEMRKRGRPNLHQVP